MAVRRSSLLHQLVGGAVQTPRLPVPMVGGVRTLTQTPVGDRRQDGVVVMTMFPVGQRSTRGSLGVVTVGVEGIAIGTPAEKEVGVETGGHLERGLTLLHPIVDGVREEEESRDGIDDELCSHSVILVACNTFLTLECKDENNITSCFRIERGILRVVRHSGGAQVSLKGKLNVAGEKRKHWRFDSGCPSRPTNDIVRY